MSSVPSYTTPSKPKTEKQKKVKSSGRTRIVRSLVIGLLIVAIVVAWQVLSAYNNSTSPTIAGRPLSNPHTHLHTLALGEKPGVLYLGTHYGLFTSRDGGHTWPQSHGTLNNYMVTSIAVSLSDPNLLALIVIPTSGLGQQSGIAFSRDSGTTWQISAPLGLSSSAYPYSVKAGSGKSGQFYAFYFYAGWLKTRDLGAHWYPITRGTLSNMQTPSLLTILYCATDQGFYHWQEESTRITQVTRLPMTTPPTRLVIDQTGNALYGLSGQDLWFSSDNGISWVHRWRFDRGDLISFVVDPLNPHTLYAGFFLPPKVVYSTDGGSSWQTLTD